MSANDFIRVDSICEDRQIMPPRRTSPKLPQLLDRKIYKTGQTRGADDDEIYQNRVGRNGTVLIPFAVWPPGALVPPGESNFENGFIVLIPPEVYFSTSNPDKLLDESGLTLGIDALVFYETREHWNAYNPEHRQWTAATSRTSPLGGEYVARIPATTAIENGDKILRGFTTTSNKGAGIRVYEYASTTTIKNCRLQLEALFWLCFDSDNVAVQNGMTPKDAATAKKEILAECQKKGLLDIDRLTKARMLDKNGYTICPLCLDALSSQGFFNRMEQAAGREVRDLTITQLNLFHIEELRNGVFNHRPYNLGWGHHHCNVVVKDAGIMETIEWMDSIVRRNIEEGHFVPTNKGS